MINLDEFSRAVQNAGVSQSHIMGLVNLFERNLDLIFTEMSLQLEKREEYN